MRLYSHNIKSICALAVLGLSACGPIENIDTPNSWNEAEHSPESLLGHTRAQKEAMNDTQTSETVMAMKPSDAAPSKMPVSDGMRLDALEMAIGQLNTKFETLQLRLLQAETQLAEYDKAAPEPQKAKEYRARKKKSASASPGVHGIRIGTHPGYVRVVMDLGQKADYSIDYDGQENVMVLELPNTPWHATASKEFSAKQPVVGSYQVERIGDGKGSRLILNVKGSPVLKGHKLIPPSTTQYHRLYVDFSH